MEDRLGLDDGWVLCFHGGSFYQFGLHDLRLGNQRETSRVALRGGYAGINGPSEKERENEIARRARRGK